MREMDLRILKEFVAEVLTVCKNDDTGITWDLYELALTVGAEIEMTKEELDKIYSEA